MNFVFTFIILFCAVESFFKLSVRGEPQLNESKDNSDTHEGSECFLSCVLHTSERSVSSFW